MWPLGRPDLSALFGRLPALPSGGSHGRSFVLGSSGAPTHADGTRRHSAAGQARASEPFRSWPLCPQFRDEAKGDSGPLSLGPRSEHGSPAATLAVGIFELGLDLRVVVALVRAPRARPPCFFAPTLALLGLASPAALASLAAATLRFSARASVSWALSPAFLRRATGCGLASAALRGALVLRSDGGRGDGGVQLPWTTLWPIHRPQLYAAWLQHPLGAEGAASPFACSACPRRACTRPPTVRPALALVFRSRGRFPNPPRGGHQAPQQRPCATDTRKRTSTQRRKHPNTSRRTRTRGHAPPASQAPALCRGSNPEP